MRSRERGVAVVLAMGVVALAAIAATAILVAQSAWARQHALAGDHAQSRALIDGAIDWSRSVLADDRRTSTLDHPGEPWALRLPPVPVENGEVAGHIEDQQGLFNLNNLVLNGKVNLGQVQRFKRLLGVLGLPGALADALADWLDPDSEPQPQNGAEDRYYLGLEVPYHAANRALPDVSELALVRGFDEDVRARLQPYVTALPRPTAVNVNTAPPEVLAAVVEGLDLSRARALAAPRERGFYRTPGEFTLALPAGATVRGEDIAVTSDYFVVRVRARIGEGQASASALLARADHRWPAIVWRKWP